MLGRHPLERMPEFFKGADALIVSLRAEPIFAMTIPGKVSAYLSAGRPILAMIDGEGAQVVREAGAGMVAPAGDGAELARLALQMAALPPEARADMAAKARAYGLQQFDRASLISQLEAMLAEAQR